MEVTRYAIHITASDLDKLEEALSHSPTSKHYTSLNRQLHYCRKPHWAEAPSSQKKAPCDRCQAHICPWKANRCHRPLGVADRGAGLARLGLIVQINMNVSISRSLMKRSALNIVSWVGDVNPAQIKLEVPWKLIFIQSLTTSVNCQHYISLI